jgi:hypothetical protein
MHFKLFEEFTQTAKYTQIKELPLEGFLESDDDDEWEALQSSLFKMGYKWPGRTSILKRSYMKEANRIYWMELKAVNGKQLYLYAPGRKIPLEEINFDDYFRPQEKYTGNHTGKKYGI